MVGVLHNFSGRDLRLHLGLGADEIVWFEHGPCSTGTSIGCGLDHAHIHVLIRPSFSFRSLGERLDLSRILTGLLVSTTTRIARSPRGVPI